MYDLIGNLIAYEDGTLAAAGVLSLFSYLLRAGLIHSMQGSYQRAAQALIDNRWLDHDGTILQDLDDPDA